MYLKAPAVDLAQETEGWRDQQISPQALHCSSPCPSSPEYQWGWDPSSQEPSCKRGAANPPPPHASQRDRASPACLHQRACCSPQCRVCCTTETFKHQGNMTFWKGEILIRHLSLIIPPLSEMHCNLLPKASVVTTWCNAIEVIKNVCQALFPFPFTRHPLEFLLAIYFLFHSQCIGYNNVFWLRWSWATAAVGERNIAATPMLKPALPRDLFGFTIW